MRQRTKKYEIGAVEVETIAKNIMFTFCDRDLFTFSKVVDLMGGDRTSFTKLLRNEMLRMMNRKVTFQLKSGKTVRLYSYDKKSKFGRNLNRETHLYGFEEV